MQMGSFLRIGGFPDNWRAFQPATVDTKFGKLNHPRAPRGSLMNVEEEGEGDQVPTLAGLSEAYFKTHLPATMERCSCHFQPASERQRIAGNGQTSLSYSWKWTFACQCHFDRTDNTKKPQRLREREAKRRNSTPPRVAQQLLDGPN